MSMTGMQPPTPPGKFLLTTLLVSVYVCQRVFINMTPQHQLEPPCIASGSLIMSLQVLANYCLVMVIDKAINTARDCRCQSEEIPLRPLVDFSFFPFFLFLYNLIFLSNVKKVKIMTLFFPVWVEHCRGEGNGCSYIAHIQRWRSCDDTGAGQSILSGRQTDMILL